MILVSKSTPRVLLKSSLNSLRVKRNKRLDLPTPESPSNRTIRKGREKKGKEWEEIEGKKWRGEGRAWERRGRQGEERWREVEGRGREKEGSRRQGEEREREGEGRGMEGEERGREGRRMDTTD